MSAVLLLLLSGTFAVVSLMTGSVVEQLVPTPLEMNSSSSEATELEAQRIGVASAVALLSGIIMVKHAQKIKASLETRRWMLFMSERLSPTALHVWPSAGLPLHLPLRANREGLHQRCRLPRHRLPAAKHAGLAAPSPHRNLLPLQSEFVFSGGTKRLGPSSLFKSILLFCLVSDFRLGDGEPASHQHGRAAHLAGVSGRPGAGEGGQHALPAAAANAHPCGDSHCESIWGKHLASIWTSIGSKKLPISHQQANPCCNIFYNIKKKKPIPCKRCHAVRRNTLIVH